MIFRIYTAERLPRVMEQALWHVLLVPGRGLYFGVAAHSRVPSCTNGRLNCTCRFEHVVKSFISSMN